MCGCVCRSMCVGVWRSVCVCVCVGVCGGVGVLGAGRVITFYR